MANDERRVRIVIDSRGADRAARALNDQLSRLGIRADLSSTALTGTFGAATKAVLGITAFTGAVLVATKQTLDFARSHAQAVTEMARLAGQANMNTDAFQALVVAGQSVGKTQEDIAKIMQDTNDRIGEMTGEGGVGELTYAFQKFLEPAGLTVDKLREMSGQDVLIAVTKAMEDSGASGAELTAVLEMIASDASHLIPLLTKNGKLTREFAKAAADMGLIIDPEQIEQSKEFNKQWDLLNKKIASMKDLMAISLMPELQKMVKYADAFAYALDRAFGISTSAQIKNLEIDLKGLNSEMGELQGKRIDSINGGTGFFGDSTREIDADIAEKRKEIEAAKNELNDLKVKQSETYRRIGDPLSGVQGSVGAVTVSDTPDDKAFEAHEAKLKREADARAAQLEAQKEAAAAYIEVIAQRNMDEFTLLDEKQAMETEKLNQFREIGAISDAEHKAAMLELEQSYADSIYAIMENESNREAALRKKDAEDEAKDKEKAAKDADKKRKSEQKDVTNMAYQTNSMLDNVAKLAQGRSDKLNALAQGAATFQATINMYTAASQAMADWSAFTPMQKAANVAMIMGMGANLISGITGAGRQSGGYMQANTPYQVGGGAHTTDPEMYQSGGKSYIVDSQAGMMKRVSGNASAGGAPRVSMTINNSGEPMNLQQQSATMDEDGVLNLIYENVPQILRDQAGNDQSDFSKAFGSIRNQDWSFT